jgi:nitrogen regulatory protein PII
MEPETKAVKITGVFHRELTTAILTAVEATGLSEYEVNAGRCLTLRDRKGFLGLMAQAQVIDYPADVFTAVVTPEAEAGVLAAIISSGDLGTQGRGTVYSEDVDVYRAHPRCGPGRVNADWEVPPVKLQQELTGICCIVQRGEGDGVARVALDTGTCVPAIGYGLGTGLRDKLGLLRVAIPAEKEVINLASSTYDAETLMDMMIMIGKLNQPGKGFIYLYPLRAGQINMKVYKGMPKHAASMEQLIVAVDEIRGGTAWRARSGSVGFGALKRRNYLFNLVTLTFTCNEGRGEDLVKAAMKAGAPGATMQRVRHVSRAPREADRIQPAREVCDMIVEPSAVAGVVAAMEEHGALDDRTHGRFCIKPVPKAYTFIGAN